MTVSAAAFVGLPGGAEFAVILLVALLLTVVPFVLIAVAVWHFVTRRSEENTDRARVAELESRVAELEAEVDELRERDET